MKIEISIRGLSLCYRNEGFWNVVFVCDDVHPLNFKSNIAPVPPIPLELHKAGSDRDIFFGIGSSPVTSLEEGNAFKSIFNLAAEYAHGPGQLQVVRAQPSRDVVWMRIPSAALSAVESSENLYFVQEFKLGAPVLIIDRVARRICAAFELTDTDGLVMSITDKGKSFDHRFPFDDSQTLTLEFNNDCGEKCWENDFYHLYDWVRAKDGKQFVAGQIKNKEMLELRNPQKLENFVEKRLLVSPEFGNCDPTVIEPPPEIPAVSQ